MYSYTNRVNILWDQHSPTSIHITGLKQKRDVNLPSLPFGLMIPKYNGWVSLVLLGKKPKQTKQKNSKPKKCDHLLPRTKEMFHAELTQGQSFPSLSQASLVHPGTMLTMAIPHHQRKERVWCAKKQLKLILLIGQGFAHSECGMGDFS